MIPTCAMSTVFSVFWVFLLIIDDYSTYEKDKKIKKIADSETVCRYGKIRLKNQVADQEVSTAKPLSVLLINSNRNFQ